MLNQGRSCRKQRSIQKENCGDKVVVQTETHPNQKGVKRKKKEQERPENERILAKEKRTSESAIAAHNQRQEGSKQ